jgi:hypothetical protein
MRRGGVRRRSKLPTGVVSPPLATLIGGLLSDQSVDRDSEGPGEAAYSLEGGVRANATLNLREIRLGESRSFGEHALTEVSSLAKSLHRFPKIRSPNRASYLSSHYGEPMGRGIARGARP